MCTATLHEIFFGPDKQLSVEHNLQVPACDRCHKHAHGRKDGVIRTDWDHKSQEEYQKGFCTLLELDYGDILLLVNTLDHDKLKLVESNGLNYIKGREVV